MSSTMLRNRGLQILTNYAKCSPACNISRERRLLYTSQEAKANFSDPEIQTLLKRITGLNVEKVFRPAKQSLEPPTYKLVSSKKLQELQEEARKEAERRLSMPPVLEEREPIDEVLAEDEGLAGLDTANVVFTDITYGLSERKRFVVVREPSGRLRKARWDERDRIMQVYFPRERREVEAPPMFADEQLPAIFAKERHEFLLDAACVQFEPDAEDFIRVHRKAYEDLDETGNYDVLRSTRHFGGMAYFFARQKRIDGLLTGMVQRDLIQDAADLVRLYCLIHPTSPVAMEAESLGLEGVALIKAYIRLDSHHSGKLELALQSWENAGESDGAQTRTAVE
ncbi:small ribosomal subunit protein mS22-like [Diadema setosum]|uniref:small ribosomal subunit protein mS22-like n=1 Tax=Diadema setosum TaxID=31175 RepID=UPI003B3A5126